MILKDHNLQVILLEHSGYCIYTTYLILNTRIPCGDGVEYLHRSRASRRRLWKRNPVPRGITGPPYSKGGYKYGDLALQVWGSLEFETVKCGHESHGTWTWEWLRWRGLAAIVNENPIICREYQGACHQDKLIGSNPPVAK
jgi:hypothetical protein